MIIPFQFSKKINKEHVENLVSLKRKEFNQLFSNLRESKTNLLESIQKQPEQSSKMLSRVKNFFSGGDKQTGVKKWKSSIEELNQDYDRKYASFLDINAEHIQVQTRAKYILYRLQRVIAWFMFGLGILRIFQIIVTFFRGRSSQKTDVVVLLVSWSLRLFNVQLPAETYRELVDNVCFGFFGVLVLTNIRGFLQNFFKFLKYIVKWNTRSFISKDTIMLLSAQVMGVYIISSFYMIIYKISDKYTGKLFLVF
jgi:hypothetical protein